MKVFNELALVCLVFTWSLRGITNSADSLAADDTLNFSGIVHQGDSYSFKLNSKLMFRLVPIQSGWIIWISSSQDSTKDFVSVSTPPFRGLNARIIEGWHFRNADNSGPNLPGDNNVNAPGELRSFYFVVNDSGYQSARQCLKVLMWPYYYSEQEVDQAGIEFSALPKGEGILYIDSLELSNVQPGQRALIQTLIFKATIIIPGI
ncbi:MAG: hypothetical protein ACP5FK_05430 [bacterium]